MDYGDITGSSTFQLGYPILNALLASSGNRGANAAHALNLGLGITNRYAEQKKQADQTALERQKIGDLFKSTTDTPAATLPGASTNLGLASEEAAGLQGLNEPKEATAATPSFASIPPQPTTIAPATSKPMFSPAQQKLGEALSQANRPDLALSLIQKMIDKRAEPMQHFGSPETGYYGVAPGETSATQLVPGVGRREPTPPRPAFGSEGGTGLRSYYDPTNPAAIGGWVTNEKPLTAAPARQLSPEQKALEGAKLTTEKARPGLISAQTGTANARTREVNQRTARLKTIVEALKDPKTSQEKIGTMHGEILRAMKQTSDDFDISEEDRKTRLDNLRVIAGDAEARMAERIRGGQGGQGASPATAPQAPPGKAIGKTKDGKTVYQDANGKKYVAN